MAGNLSARGEVNDDKNEDDKKTECLRDVQLSKKELAKLDKKEWGSIKDLVFETDDKVLDYLAFHANR